MAPALRCLSVYFDFKSVAYLDLETARRKRLQALASKFKVYDDDDNEGGAAKSKKSATLSLATAAASSSPSRRDRTKVVDVDKEVHRMSSATKNLAGDSNFLNSLKAQGFEETQSKTKLVSRKEFKKVVEKKNMD